jgi:hypothetical protein
MIRLTKKDIDIANKILTDEAVFEMICDDGMTEDFKSEFVTSYLEHPGIFVLHPNQWTIFIFSPRNLIMYEAHTAILPAGRGRDAIKAGRDSIEYMFTQTTCQKVISLVPFFNPMAGMFARWCKLTREGTIPDSFLKNGELYDQTIYGISKKEWKKCQQQSQ